MRFLCLHGAGTSAEVCYIQSECVNGRKRKLTVEDRSSRFSQVFEPQSKAILEDCHITDPCSNNQAGGITQELENKGHKFVYVNGRLNSKPEAGLWI
jgi:hypothetical protein